jgi:UDP:flavonoid glycosyltransferase YjiC (YdhE family)
MARFLFCPAPEPGDTNPTLPVAAALRDRGHRVGFLTAPEREADLAEAGFDALVAPGGVWGTAAELPSRVAMLDVPRLRLEVDALDRAADAWAPDVLLDGAFPFGTRLFAEVNRLRRATLCAGSVPIPTADPLFPHGLGHLPPRTERERALARLAVLCQVERDAPELEAWNRARRAWGLAPAAEHPWRAAASDDLVMLATSPAFEYPRSDLPKQFWFVGPLRPSPGFAEPDPFHPPADGRPLIFASQGATFNRNPVLLRRVIEALAAEPYAVVLTTMRAFDPAEFAPLPPNMQVRRSVRLEALAPALVITHGGAGTVNTSLWQGVPVLAMPFTADQFEVASRIVWSGAGLRLGPWESTDDDVRRAVRALCHEPTYLANAARIAADHRAQGGPVLAARLLERLAATGGPVRRDEAPPAERTAPAMCP